MRLIPEKMFFQIKYALIFRKNVFFLEIFKELLFLKGLFWKHIFGIFAHNLKRKHGFVIFSA